MTKARSWCFVALVVLLCCSCSNDPYRPGEAAEATCFMPFSTVPTKLDPTSAYYSHEGRIIDQIYEPPFNYHYLKRPYEVVPMTAEEVPQPVYYDTNGVRMAEADPPMEKVGRAEYMIRIKKGILFQNHPCFAKDDEGAFIYRNVRPKDIADFASPSEFEHQDTRELTAADYVLQFRRLADPRLASPIFSTLAQYVLGMGELQQAYAAALEEERARRKEAAGPTYSQERDERENPIDFDYMGPEFPGMVQVDRYTYKVMLSRKYPQIIYWLCMHFAGPMPQEALDFYNQPAMIERQFTINKWPVGTGAYYLKTFKRNEIIVLERNPNYHEAFYPEEGAPGDREAGLLVDAGKRIPFIDRQVLKLEKESIPAWTKFLQGYYDASGIGGDVFDKAIQMTGKDEPGLSDAMKAQGIKLLTDVDTMFWYTQFNMSDPVVGGLEPEKAKLRQAISIALDYNEYLDIFANGRGILAQGPIPPGISGYRAGEEGTNPYVNKWNPEKKRHERLPIEHAQKLMKEAGYPGGRTSSGEPLTIYYDHSAMGRPGFRSYLQWIQRKLDQIGVKLEERATDLARYRQKLLNGNWQIASGGWLADYPDPENFLFLFYGPNGKAKYKGPNSCNYANPEYDRLFKQMESMQPSPRRQELIDEMMDMLQKDCPAVWQYFPLSYSLQHEWYKNVKLHQMSYSTMRFKRIDAALRVAKQREWNRPNYKPVIALLAILVIGTIPAAVMVYRRERRAG